LAETLDNLSDESLMERIQKHDHRAFSCLVERRSDMFYAAAYRMVMNRQEAEDIVQEAFLKLWDKPKSWKSGNGAKFTTWFYRIVMNISLDKLRRQKNGNGDVDQDLIDQMASGDMAQDRELEINEEQKALDRALKTLPENQLMALNLCFYEEMSNKEAADIMGIGVKALESLLMRAKSGIKNYLHREGILDRGEVA